MRGKRGAVTAGGARHVSLIVPSRTGNVKALQAQLARQSLSGWELIVQSRIAPPAKARNLGAAKAQSEILIFLDDDIRFGQAGLLADLVEALETTGPASAVGVGWRLPPDASAFQRWLMRESFERQAAEGQDPASIPWHGLGASCIAIWRQAFEALGGFDEQLVSGEDHELWYRLFCSGGGLYLLPRCWIYHEPPATFRAAVRKTIWYERGNAQVARKHPAARYRMPLRSRWHAAAYLLARTVLLPMLMFIKVSYQRRRPAIAFRPLAALLSYIGAWAYCLSWFAASAPDAGSPPGRTARDAVAEGAIAGVGAG